MNGIVFEPIGFIRSPFLDVEGMPVQPIGARGVKGTIELKAELEPGLKDLDGFSHVILVYWFHLSTGYSLHVLPFLDRTLRGVFSTRIPRRPNSIGLSVVKLTGIRGAVLDIEEVDVVDGTPLLDIKPYVPQFDNREVQRVGWFTDRAHEALVVRADRRFVDTTRQLGSSIHEPCDSGDDGMKEARADSRVRDPAEDAEDAGESVD